MGPSAGAQPRPGPALQSILQAALAVGPCPFPRPGVLAPESRGEISRSARRGCGGRCDVVVQHGHLRIGEGRAMRTSARHGAHLARARAVPSRQSRVRRIWVRRIRVLSGAVTRSQPRSVRSGAVRCGQPRSGAGGAVKRGPLWSAAVGPHSGRIRAAVGPQSGEVGRSARGMPRLDARQRIARAPAHAGPDTAAWPLDYLCAARPGIRPWGCPAST